MSDPLPKKRILIIDDDRPGAETRRLQLERRGYEVLLAPAVRQAKEIVAEEILDLIICDWVLPDGHGDEVVRFIKTFSPEVPCLVHSAFESSDGQATGAGAEEFVLKGAHPDALINAVVRALKRREEEAATAAAACAAMDTAGPDPARLALHNRLAEILRGWLGLPETCDAPMCLELGNRVDYLSVLPVMRLWAGRGRTHVLDCARVHSGGAGLEAWFGHVERRQQEVVAFHRGMLEERRDDLVIIRHWEKAENNLGEEMCRALRSGHITRRGARTQVPMALKIVLCIEAEAATPAWGMKGGDFYQIIAPRWYEVKDRVVGEAPVWRFTQSLFELYQNSYHRMSLATRTVLRQLPPSITLHSIQRALERVEETPAAKVEPEDLELNVLEGHVMHATGVTGTRAGRPALALGTIDEARDAMEAYYVRRVLSECEGNVAEAARVANVGRQMIYKYLKKHAIDVDDYKPQDRDATADDLDDDTEEEAKAPPAPPAPYPVAVSDGAGRRQPSSPSRSAVRRAVRMGTGTRMPSS